MVLIMQIALFVIQLLPRADASARALPLQALRIDRSELTDRNPRNR